MTDPSHCEVSWFSALCDDDYEFLGVSDPGLVSSWEHCRDIALTAEAAGFDNILLPSGYALGIDSLAFAAAIAPLLRRMRLLAATRCGEMWPPQLARQFASIDQMLGGRLTINIISSDLPGQTLASAPRYARTVEVMQILRTVLDGQPLDHDGEAAVRRVRAHPRGRDWRFAPGLAAVIGAGEWDLVHIQSYHTFVAPMAMAAA